MTSLQIGVSPTRRAAARFIAQVRRELQKALALANIAGVRQADLARTIGVHRSVVNREMRGQADLTLGRVAELATALGYRPVFRLERIYARPGSNQPDQQSLITTTSTTEGVVFSSAAQTRISQAAI